MHRMNGLGKRLTDLAALSLTGCISASPGLPNIFLAAIRVPGGVELRIGYFGKMQFYMLHDTFLSISAATISLI